MVLFLSSWIGCESDDWTKNYEIKRTVIKEVKRRHWGKGLFVETILFDYTLDNKKYSKSFESNRKETSYTSSYSIGDSLVLKIRPNQPNDFKIVQLKRHRN